MIAFSNPSHYVLIQAAMLLLSSLASRSLSVKFLMQGQEKPQ